MELYTINDKFDNNLIFIMLDNEVLSKGLKSFYKSLKIQRFESKKQALEYFYDLEISKAKKYVYNILSKKSYHSIEIRKKLLDKFISQKTTEYLITDLINKGYLNDNAWIQRYIEKEFQKGYSLKMIELKLRYKNIFFDSTPITSDMQKSKIIELIKKRFKIFDRKKAISFLLRRGFEYSIVQEVLSNLE